MRAFTIGDIVMSGGGYVEGWYFSKIKGWFGFEDVTQESDEIEGGDGSFFEEVSHLPSAVISISGVYVGSSPEDAARARVSLSRVRNRGRSTWASFEDDLSATGREVFVRSIIPDNNQHASFEFSMDLVAYDPFRYGEETTEATSLSVKGYGGLEFPIRYAMDFGVADSRGRIVLSNPGSEASSPSFVIRGGRIDNGVRLRRAEDGTSIWFRKSLNPSDVLLLDPERQTATLNGNDNSIYITVEEWPEIAPGEAATVQFIPLGATDGDATLTGKIRPAYL